MIGSRLCWPFAAFVELTTLAASAAAAAAASALRLRLACRLLCALARHQAHRLAAALGIHRVAHQRWKQLLDETVHQRAMLLVVVARQHELVGQHGRCGGSSSRPTGPGDAAAATTATSSSAVGRNLLGSPLQRIGDARRFIPDELSELPIVCIG